MDLAKLAENHCASMNDWLSQNRDNLPATYDEVIRFPAECRKLLFVELPPAVQSAVWRTQIERYRAQHPALNAEQRAVLDRAAELLSPSSLAIPQDSPERTAFDAAVEALHEQSVNAFGKKETGILFAQIGPGDEESVRAQFGGRQ